MIGWGQRQGKQRFHGKNGGLFFTRNDPSRRHHNRFTWFRKWVLERQTFKTLRRDSGLSIDTLQRTFYTFLAQAPKVNISKPSRVHLQRDATCFTRFCLLSYQDREDGSAQLIRFSDGGHYQEIKEELDNLIRLGVQIESITCDGRSSRFKAVKTSLPDGLVQRCLVHIERMCLLWLTRYPKPEAGVELRAWVLMLLKIKTHNDRRYRITEVEKWYNRHKVYLGEKTYNQVTGKYRYPHKLLRRSYFTIKRALPNRFHYLSNPAIPNTTNGIEGLFSHLKNHLDLHRGLTPAHRIHFIKWYTCTSPMINEF